MNPEARKKYLDVVCRDAPALRAELEVLLENQDADQGVPINVLDFRAVQAYKPGMTVGHYEIVKKIGQGGMGVIYKARDIKLKRPVALKFLPTYLSADAKSRLRFIEEARAASSIDHPNICTVYEISELEDGTVYIAMAYYEGGTLKQIIERKPLSVDKAVDVSIQLCTGLVQAHARGIIHRDIKPANVIVTQEGVVKIVDFGVAKQANLNITSTGDTIGTVFYMAPEQVIGENVDHRVDIWSVGIVLYEMLTGHRPFDGRRSHAVAHAILNKEPRPVTGLRTGIPLQLAHIVQRLMTKAPAERYQDLQDVIADLTQLKDRHAARASADDAVRQDNNDADRSPGVLMNDEEDVLHILFVDDEPEFELLMRSMFRRKVKKNGWVFEFAMSGQEALEKLQTNRAISLVLTDLNMPEMDGLTLLDHIHELKRPLKTVVVTAYSDLDNIRAAMNRGAFDFVTKPVNVADLEATIRKSANELKKELKVARYERQLVSLQKELDVARQIQEAIQPAGFSTHPDLDLYAFSMAAHEISGTFYDYYWINDHTLGFLIGDVGGKGISAAVVMSMVQTYCKSVALQGHSPGECMSMINRLLVPEGFPDLAVSAFYGIIDAKSQTLSYCNAGHPVPYCVRNNGRVEPEPVQQEAALWKHSDVAYHTYEEILGQGDTLFVYTRGLVDALNEEGIPFSATRIAQTLHDAPKHTPGELIRTVIRQTLAFTQDTPLPQDLTMLALQPH